MVYLPDPRNGVVHAVNRANGRRMLVIGGRTGATPMRAPEAVAARCEAAELFVLDARQVHQFNAASGEFIRSTPRPDTVGMGTGGAGLVVGEDVIFAALWLPYREALRDNPEAEMLRGARLGYVKRDADARGLLPIVTEQCRHATPCGRVGLDRVRLRSGTGQTTEGWLACQGAGGMVGFFNDAGDRVGQIDVRSPAFLDDGTSVAASEPIPQKVKWQQRNSAVMWCGGFDDVVAVVHASLESREWQPGMALAPRPFMNLYRTDGSVIMVDVPLKDLPVAEDDRTLYILDYGDARRTNGAHRLRMERLPILEPDGRLADWLTTNR